MAYKEHLRVRISGTFGPTTNPNEIWSTGFQLGNADESDVPNMPTTAQFENVYSAISAWWSATASKFKTTDRLTRVVMSWIDATGHVKQSAITGGYYQYVNNFINGVAGGATGTEFPYQCCTVIGLHTLRAGRGGRGRMFVPQHLVPIESDGKMSTSNAQSLAQQAANMLAAVNTAMEEHGSQVAVVSSSEHVSPVTSLRVGTVYDTQRRRRNDLDEAYQFWPVTA